jgi:hypothetical protein
MNIPEQFVRSINQESTDKDINILSHVWYKNCGKITRDIKISFINFKFIRSISVTMLVEFINSEDYTARIIDKFIIGSKDSVDKLRNSLEKLLGILEDIMKVSDFNIIQIADSLREKNI